jgi:hypothetical protein
VHSQNVYSVAVGQEVMANGLVGYLFCPRRQETTG